MKKIFLLALTFVAANSFAQEDSIKIRTIFNNALSGALCHENLRQLTTVAPGRISGSENAAKAVTWAQKRLQEMGFDTVYLQECMVPRWVRGEKEQANYTSKGVKKDVRVTALGMIRGTGEKGLTAEVVEVKSFEELEKLGKAGIQGKIVFFNRPFDEKDIMPFQSYGKCVDQRWMGPSLAAKYGASGVVVRSMTHALDDYPHTGAMEYVDSLPKIPAVAISTIGAEMLSSDLKKDNKLKFFFRTTCRMEADVKSHNVIAEIRGSDKNKGVILVGGHLDAWDNGEGAHDDGAGCVQSMEVLNILKRSGIKPQHTIRAVLFMNEENGGRGADKYAQVAKEKKEKQVASIESDAGGSSPRGFSMIASEKQRSKIRSWRPLLEPYGVYDFDRVGAGADVEQLKDQGSLVMELLPDPQRYFDYHHTENDKFIHVHKRELELGAGAMAALVYLIDRYGVE